MTGRSVRCGVEDVRVEEGERGRSSLDFRFSRSVCPAKNLRGVGEETRTIDFDD